ncbi:MAG TPA: BatA domain-containing protein [Pirellulales bacterium]|nr:BatA domain-containing protein [Pirellulales bacterium]
MTLPAITAAIFLHPTMLFWASAAAVPIVIHLLSRRKHREVYWAAMQYLLAAVRKNSRRIQVEQWILLALRTAAIALAVLAVAQPGCDHSGLGPGGNDRTHKMLVVDSSFSMGYKPTDKSRFDRAKELAARIVDESNQGDGFTLLVLANPPRVVVGTPAFERRDFLEEIENLKLWHGGANLPATLAQAEEVLTRAARENPRLVRHEIYFLTDLGRNTWSAEGEGAAAAEFRQRTARLAREAQLLVLDLGQADSENTAVVDLQTTDPLTTVGHELTIEGTLRNFGHASRERQLVELFIDGHKTGQDYVDLPPGGQASVTFPYRFDAPGDHGIELRLASDLLPLDNHRWLAASTKDQLRVLCVTGNPDGRFHGSTDYLAVALAPNRKAPERSLVQPQVVPESALLEVELSNYDCVFLANVGQFTGSEAQAMASYLKHGGGIVCFLGDQVQADSYNRRLSGRSSDGSKVLPATIANLGPQGSYHFDPLNYQHPLLNVFRDQEQAGLITTPIARYFKLEVPPDSAAHVAMAFDNGDPAIVEEPIGRGRSILLATSADTSWSAMPLWPSFPPLVHELLSLAIRGKTAEQNIVVGQLLGDSFRGQAGQGSLSLRLPSGDAAQARVAADGEYTSWSFADTGQSGMYVAHLPPPYTRDELFAVNVDTSESDLARLDPAELRDSVWNGVDFVLRTDWQDLNAPSVDTVVRRQWLHIYLLTAVVALLLIESVLAMYFGRRAA